MRKFGITEVKVDVLISIIVPVYNTENYLEKCLLSIFANINDKLVLNNSFEIIIVNDGSTDGSHKLIAEFAKIHSNIRIISQPNQGLSVARNNGIKIARGVYVWFIDSDDWIEPFSLETLYRIIIKTNPDIIAFGAKNYTANKLSRERPLIFKGECSFSGPTLIEKDIYQTCSTFYLFSREFIKINNLNFYPNIYHEDVEFIPRALFVASSVYLLNQNLYCVNEREGSITRSYIPKKSDDLLIVADNLIEYFQSLNSTTHDLMSSMNTRIAIALNSALHNSKRNRENLAVLISKISNNKKYISCFLGSNSFKHKVEGYLFYYPKLFLWLYLLSK